MGGRVVTANDASRTASIAIVVIAEKRIGRLRTSDTRIDCQYGSFPDEPAKMAPYTPQNFSC